MGDGRALGDLRVIELSTGIAGGYATKLFADAGADVVKVEPPGGDPLRRWSASGTPPGDADGALFRFLAASKRSVVGCLGDDQVVRLVADADLVVENFEPGVIEAAGLLDQPRLVVLSISPFGRGSWAKRPATEFTVQAESGSISQRGRPDRPPVQAGGRLGEWAAGVFGAAPSLFAVREARRSGRGSHIDVSMAEVMALSTNLFIDLMLSLLGHPSPLPQPARAIEFPSIEPTADGWVGFNTNSAQMWADFLAMVERSDLLDSPALRADPVLKDDLERSIQAWTTQRTTAEVVETASLFRIPVAPVGNAETLLGAEHIVARGLYEHRVDQGFSAPKPPYWINGQRPPLPGPPPRLGEHDGLIEDHRRRPPTGEGSASAGALPLAGLKVLDLTCWWAGPASTQLLAGLGADVIHVEAVQRIDGMRPAATTPFAALDQWWERSSFYLSINVNKRGLTLNLGDPDGVALAERLIGWADIVVENYTPRVMENFGLDWAAVHRINPAAVMVRMPAFGLAGPWRDRVGFAETMEQMSGMAWTTGYPDGEPTMPRGPCDPLGGMHGAFALGVGLMQRDATGQGLLVEASLLESALNLAAEQVVEYTASGTILHRQGNRTPGCAPQGLYACTGVEQWLALSVADDDQWVGLCAALEHPLWAKDPVLSSAEGRAAHQDRLDSELTAWAATRDLADTVELLLAHGVPAAPVVDYRIISAQPLLNERGFFEASEHPVVGRHLVMTLPFRYRGIDRWIRTPAPTLGQHNVEILSDVLGLEAAEIDDLATRQVIGTRPIGL